MKDTSILLFDTTMRDGELFPGFKMNLAQKLELAKILEQIGIDVIEVGYPGNERQDFLAIQAVSSEIATSIVCGLAGSKPSEIECLGEALAGAVRGRINIYTNLNLRWSSDRFKVIDNIAHSIKLATNYCDDIQWSAFDAIRSDRDFLYQTIEVAIAQGAKTICIPDTFGSLTPQEFTNLIKNIVNSVPNCDRAILSVHCHDDLGMAVDNSLAAITSGARQIECSICGIGARKGNANLEKIIDKAIALNYNLNYQTSLISQASNLVSKILSS
jgi:2-isopropylmalate synthase